MLMNVCGIVLRLCVRMCVRVWERQHARAHTHTHVPACRSHACVNACVHSLICEFWGPEISICNTCQAFRCGILHGVSVSFLQAAPAWALGYHVSAPQSVFSRACSCYCSQPLGTPELWAGTFFFLGRIPFTWEFDQISHFCTFSFRNDESDLLKHHFTTLLQARYVKGLTIRNVGKVSQFETFRRSCPEQ